MKRVLFIGVTNYNLEKPEAQLHLKKKFEGLSKGIEVFVLAKGKPFHRKIWDAEFYLLPQRFFSLLAFPLASHLCLVKKIDTILCQSPLIEGFIGSILKKVFGKELIIEVHGDWVEAPFLYKKRWPKAFWQKIFEILGKISLKNADKIRAVSTFTKEKALKVTPGKPCFIFPTFTDLSLFFKEKEIRFNNFIFFVGQLEKVKGVEFLIEAFSKISTDFPEFKLVIIGEGEDLSHLKKLAGFSIDFLGWQKEANKIEYFRNCRALIFPGEEDFGIVPVEAMAAGKPVIAYRKGGALETIVDGKTGIFFDQPTSSALAAALRQFMTQEDKFDAQLIAQHAQKFNKERFKTEMVKLIHQELRLCEEQ